MVESRKVSEEWIVWKRRELVEGGGDTGPHIGPWIERSPKTELEAATWAFRKEQHLGLRV